MPDYPTGTLTLRYIDNDDAYWIEYERDGQKWTADGTDISDALMHLAVKMTNETETDPING